MASRDRDHSRGSPDPAENGSAHRHAPGGSGHGLACPARIASKARATREHANVVEPAPDDLQPDRQALVVKAAIEVAAGCSDMLKATVKPMCGNGLSGSRLGDAHSAGKAVIGAVGDSTKSNLTVASTAALRISGIWSKPRNT